MTNEIQTSIKLCLKLLLKKNTKKWKKKTFCTFKILFKGIF